MTAIFHDWKFFADGTFIHPISVGMVTDTGDSFYAIFEEGGYYAQKNNWLKNNVYTHIEHELVTKATTVKSKEEIAKEILEFIKKQPDPELWAWYGAHDHVSLTQLFGRMTDMPEGIPWFTNDIKTLQLLTLRRSMRNEGLEPPKQDSATEHHALYDAMHDRDLYSYYMGFL